MLVPKKTVAPRYHLGHICMVSHCGTWVLPWWCSGIQARHYHVLFARQLHLCLRSYVCLDPSGKTTAANAVL